MNCFVLDLFFSSAHKITNSSLSVFSPISLDVYYLHGSQLTIESCQKWQQEILLTLQPEVTISEIISPCKGTSLTEHVKILGCCDKSQSNQSSDEDKGLSPCHTEVFIVSTHLLGTSKFAFDAVQVAYSKKNWFVLLMKRMNVCSLGGSLDRFSFLGGISYFFLESLEVSSISFSEYSEGALCDVGVAESKSCEIFA